MPNPYRITDEMVDDILAAAFEGGITYWTDEVKFQNPDAVTAGTFASDAVSQGHTILVHEWEDGEPGTWHELTLAKMKKGIRAAATAYGLTPERFHEEHDAGSADNAVQYAIFGRIIFG